MVTVVFARFSLREMKSTKKGNPSVVNKFVSDKLDPDNGLDVAWDGIGEGFFGDLGSSGDNDPKARRRTRPQKRTMDTTGRMTVFGTAMPEDVARMDPETSAALAKQKILAKVLQNAQQQGHGTSKKDARSSRSSAPKSRKRPK